MSKAKTKTAPRSKAKTKTAPRSKAKTKTAPRSKATKKSRAVLPGKPAATGGEAPAMGGDWRVETLERMRSLILEADPQMIEERKWKKPTKPLGVPVWSHDGIVCTGETYQRVVKLTFMRGASLPDPAGLFNASLDGGTRRAIDIAEGEKVDARAFKALVKAAVAENAAKK